MFHQLHKRLHTHTISFQHAFDGLIWCLKTQPNYQVHLILSSIAIVASVVLQISYEEFLIIVLLIIFGLVIETINTALEQTTDAIDLTIREDIKIAKDVAAGAMLIFAVGATLISIMIFIPRFSSILFMLLN
jgi:diacylglycerol kinase